MNGDEVGGMARLTPGKVSPVHLVVGVCALVVEVTLIFLLVGWL
jgi:hypothetical protein